MTSEEIIRRVAEQSFLLCFEPDKVNDKGIVVEQGKRITRQRLTEAVNEIFRKPLGS